MRIAFLGPSHPWRGGIAQFAQNMAAKLAEQKHEIMMFTFIHQYPALLFPGSDQKDTANQFPNLATQKILTPYNPLSWFSAIHDIRAWHPDIIVVSYSIPFSAPAYGFILRFLKRTRKVVLIHNIDFHEKWLLARALTKFALKPADDYITLSEISSKALLELVTNLKQKKLLQLFHPVYEYLHLHDAHDDSVKHKILFFGFIKPYKGLDTLLQAMAIVIRQKPDLKLVIAGDVYGDRKTYPDLIEKLQIRNNTELHLRYISDAEIETFFNDCDVCVLPYRSATQSGVAQLAFSFDVPVIAAKVGGIEEVVKDETNGLLVEPENPEALAEKILEFYAHNYLPDFRTNIRSINQKNSWDNFTQRFLDYLQ